LSPYLAYHHQQERREGGRRGRELQLEGARGEWRELLE